MTKINDTASQRLWVRPPPGAVSLLFSNLLRNAGSKRVANFALLSVFLLPVLAIFYSRALFPYCAFSLSGAAVLVCAFKVYRTLTEGCRERKRVAVWWARRANRWQKGAGR